PDGTRLAWFSDATGEDQLMIGDQDGKNKPRAIALPPQDFFTNPTWSPDARKMLFRDTEAKLWLLDVATGKFTTVDSDTFNEPGRGFEVSWSPDSRWVAYSKSMDNQLRAIFVYSLASGKATQITDNLADAISPSFDAGGKYLYFLASTNFALNSGWLDMSSMERPTRRSIYLTVLGAHEPSPLAPTPSDEPERAVSSDSAAPKPVPARAAAGAAGKPAAHAESPSAARVVIDLDGIQQRIIALPAPPADYGALTAGGAGTFFYVEARANGRGQGGQLLQYQLAAHKPRPFLDGVDSYSVSADAKKILYQAPGNHWGVIPTEQPAKPGDGMLDVDQLETLVDPKAEWAQIFRETWRTQRDFFYDPKMHGNDWNKIYEKYSVFVPYIRHRADLAYLIATVGGELTVGHSYLEGAGDVPDTAHTSVGLLGADVTADHGRYRIQRIYTAGSWNPRLMAPLSAPGLQVAEGDYILEVNGRSIAAPANFYSAFVGAADKSTTLRLSHTPTADGSWVVTITPIDYDEQLRTQAWIDDNRKLVDKLSGGRLAYVWLPNTSVGGYTAFNRYYYSQQEKQGAVIDERYNQGGSVADYIVDQLSRKLMGYFARRAGKT
ncbi:MAG: PDZ domain-containing protein, partial [Gemmatimonadaceae bacterium]